MHIRAVGEHQDIARIDDRRSDCTVIVSGLACRYKFVRESRRQILSLHFAGDIPDLDGLALPKADQGVCALTPVTVASISHAHLRGLAAAHPTFAEALTRQAMVDGSILGEWIANVGRRFAVERVAHLICESFTRMRALGLADADSFDLPMTQADMGDATGLSNVHVNRTMTALKKSGVLAVTRRSHRILDWARLRDHADFNPAYLHLLPAT